VSRPELHIEGNPQPSRVRQATPIDRIMEAVEWKPLPAPIGDEAKGLYATHDGVLAIGGLRFRCYQLNDGQRLLDADDVERVFDVQLAVNRLPDYKAAAAALAELVAAYYDDSDMRDARALDEARATLARLREGEAAHVG
jgi:hypothetical protein